MAEMFEFSFSNTGLYFGSQIPHLSPQGQRLIDGNNGFTLRRFAQIPEDPTGLRDLFFCERRFELILRDLGKLHGARGSVLWDSKI